MANHSSHSSMPSRTCNTSQYRLTSQSRRLSQSIQSCKNSPPIQSRRSNRYSQSKLPIRPSIHRFTSHTCHSSLLLTITSYKSTQSSQASHSSQPSLPSHSCHTIHFTQYFLRSQSSLPDLSLRGIPRASGLYT